MADELKPSTLAKIAGAVAAVGAAWAAQRIVSLAWRTATGHRPPRAEDEGDQRFAEVAAAAAVSGALVALARVYAARGTARLSARVNANRPS